MTDTINNQIPFVPENTIDPAAGLNLSLNTIDALLQVIVQSVGLNTAPTGVAGQRFIVGTEPTAAWSGQANKLARFMDGAWQFFDARYVLNAADGAMWVKSDLGWSAIAGEWSAETVNQAEAESGTSTTRRAWTALRVRQAVAAWWLTVSTAFGRSLVGAANAGAGRAALELGTAATASVTVSSTDATGGRILKVGDFGTGVSAAPPMLGDLDATSTPSGAYFVSSLTLNIANCPSGTSEFNLVEIRRYDALQVIQTFYQRQASGTGVASWSRGYNHLTSAWGGWVESYHTGNLTPNRLAAFTLSTLPSAAANARLQVYVSNLAGQAGPAFSDGTNWRRVSDNTIAN